MDYAAIVLLDIVYGVALIALISIGLAIVFGMMRVINLAHGEFLMLGAYATALSVNAGANVWFAMLVISPLFVGVVGFIVERLIIRRLYGRMIDTMLATWGLSLAIVGLVKTFYGATTEGFANPVGAFRVGAYTYSGYNLFVIGATVVIFVVIWAALAKTRAGLIARGAMQNADMAAALGVNPGLVYSATFTIGAAVTGLAGGILAPLVSLKPDAGIAFIAKAFITVISGGASILTGATVTSGLYGSISQIFTFWTTPVFGEIALLIVAIVLLRLLPQGVTGRFFRGRM